MGKDFGKLSDNKKLSGSQAATLVGVNPYQSENDLMNFILYHQGVEGATEPPQPEGEFLQIANDVEPLIINRAVDKISKSIGKELKHEPEVRDVYKYKDLFEVSLDSIVFHEGSSVIKPSEEMQIIFPKGQSEIVLEGDGIIEAKNTRIPPRELPEEYMGVWQLQMQMLCYGAKWGAVSVLYQGYSHFVYIYERDEEMVQKLIDMAIEFYQRVNNIDWYPVRTSSDGAKTYANGEDDLPSINLSELSEDILELVNAKDTIKTLEEQINKELEPKIMNKLGNHTKGYLDDEEGNRFVDIKWGMRNYKAQPEKVIKAKPAERKRQKSLTIVKAKK